MSNVDNMRIVAILSTMLVHHHYIEEDGNGGKFQMPAEPIKVIDKVVYRIILTNHKIEICPSLEYGYVNGQLW